MADMKFDLPGYEMLGTLGSGAYGSVWKARQLSLDRLVAIKFLSHQFTGDATDRQRFREEARAAARLRHRGIVQVFDAGELDETVYYVMEYVVGRTVGRYLAGGHRLDEESALLIVDGVANVLRFAWEQERIIHCDIKPENVLFDEADGSVKVTDLGVARVVGRPTDDDQYIVGTPNYMSPEQAHGQTALDCRTDIYALGAMMYHMVTGALPFGEIADADEVLEQQVTGYLPDPMEVQPKLSLPAAWLIEKMMVKDPAIRYPGGWDEVLADITLVQAGKMPSDPRPPPGASTVRRGIARVKATAALDSAVQPHSSEQASGETLAANDAQASSPDEKKRLVIRKQATGKNSQRKRITLGGLALALLRILVWSILLIVALGGIIYLLQKTGVVSIHHDKLAMTRPAHTETTPAEAETAVEQPTAMTSPEAAPTAEAAAPEPAVQEAPPAETPPAPVTAQPWSAEQYRDGARNYNAAVRMYKEYLKSRKNKSVLKEIQSLCRGALALIEPIKDAAPKDVPAELVVTNCYKLIEDCRQSTTLGPDDEQAHPAELYNETPEAQPAAADPSTPPEPAATNSVTPPQIIPGRASGLISMPEQWTRPITSADNTAARELARILARHCQPSDSRGADGQLIVYPPDMLLLMPATEALKKLNVTQLPERKAIETPGFPKGAFFYYEVPGNYEGGFRRALLVTDQMSQLVAVGLINEAPEDPPRLPLEAFYSTRLNILDFIRNRRIHGEGAERVGHWITLENNGQVLRLDTELAEPRGKENSVFYRMSLWMPKSVADLLMGSVRRLMLEQNAAAAR